MNPFQDCNSVSGTSYLKLESTRFCAQQQCVLVYIRIPMQLGPVVAAGQFRPSR